MKIYTPSSRLWEASANLAASGGCSNGCNSGCNGGCNQCGCNQCGGGCTRRVCPPRPVDDDCCCDTPIVDPLPFAPVYAEMTSTATAEVPAGSLIPMTSSNRVSPTGIAFSLSSGTFTIEETGIYRVYYAVMDSSGAPSIGLSIDGNTVPGSVLPLTTAELLTGATRLIPLISGQTIGIMTLSSALTPASVSNSSNAILSIERID